MAVPQFGRPQPGRPYPDRPAAFAVVQRDGRLAVLEVERRDLGRVVLDLPGGGIDEGETARDAAIRETGEEAGLRVELEPEPFLLADHYFVHEDGRTVNTRGRFFAGLVAGEAPELKIEDDHALVWVAPAEAALRLYRNSHAWAVTTWMRRLHNGG